MVGRGPAASTGDASPKSLWRLGSALLPAAGFGELGGQARVRVRLATSVATARA